MIRGFYTARSGLMAQQMNMDVVANNFANVNTVGFKPMKASFTDLMYQNLNRTAAENEVMVGHGSRVSKTDLILSPGSLESTSRSLDFAIVDSQGFFAVENSNGDIEYTRAGNFIMSTDDEGATFYLCTPNGDRVLDEDEGEIELEFDEDGKLDFDPSVIGVFRFPNPYGLSATGNNRYTATDVSGEAEAVEEPVLKAGYVEQSAVDIAGEMAKMIEVSKAFSFNSRMVTVADEIEQTVNSLR